MNVNYIDPMGDFAFIPFLAYALILTAVDSAIGTGVDVYQGNEITTASQLKRVGGSFAINAITGGFATYGQAAKWGTKAVFASSVALDTTLGTAYDTAIRGQDFKSSLAMNFVGSVLGNGIALGVTKTYGRVHNNKIVMHKFDGIEKQLDFLEKNIPGINREQTKFLIESANAKGSSTVFGGSRVRGNYRADSDLDVGFGNLSTGQAKKLVNKANRLRGLHIEDGISIVPGNSTRNIKVIKSPEEFFSRSGFRTDGLHKFDPRRIFRPFKPSGSISVLPDGTIKVIKP